MRLLLDTHVFLWSLSQPDEIDSAARALIADRNNDIFVSAAVAWEIGIKVSLRKLTLPGDPAVWFPARLESLGCTLLSINAAHALAAATLPPIHNDPFDRMMVAQAQIESLTLVTRNEHIGEYAVQQVRA